MTFLDRFGEYVRACFTGLWIESHEHQDALHSLASCCRQEQWQLATWNMEQGFSVDGVHIEGLAMDPLTAIRHLNSLATPDGTVILVLQNFHRFLQSAEIVQALAGQVIAGKQNRTILVILSPVVQLPVELEKLFVVLEHELPDREQLADIARGIATEPAEMPEGADLVTVLDAAAGLTRLEAENAFSLSLVRHARITPDAVWELKTQILRKSGSLELHRGTDDFRSLGGLTSLKSFCQKAMRRRPAESSPQRPRGVLLLSPPGCGKSQFCKALGHEVQRPILILDVGSLMGSLVGQSEERTRQALRVIDAMAPCVLMIDEVEKAFSGVNGSGDSGVSSRMFGTFLSWLNDHESDVFVVCTANDVTRLPPEFGRSERFDAIFFLDLPEQAEKDAIWTLYRDRYGIDPDQRRPDDTDWTGAEIKACCRLSALLEVSLTEAAQNVVPVAITASESVERLRTWASGRCLSASVPGIYRRDQAVTKQRRRLAREALNN